MATHARHPRLPIVLPGTTGGWVAVAVFGLAVLFLAGRVLLAPYLPFSYLTVLLGVVAAGVVALYAVTLGRERGLSVFAVLVVGMLSAAVLLAESFGGSGQVPTVSIGEGDNGRTVSVQRGGQLLVQLPGNPSTGYDWEVGIGDPAVLTQSGAPLVKPAGTGLGAGSTYYFWFDTGRAGRTDLTFVYRRAWETGVAPIRTYRVTVNVT